MLSKQTKTRSPPSWATYILELFLPIELQNPVLGDLQEEYNQCVVTGLSSKQANAWYYRQVFTTAIYYLWKGKVSNMAYLFSFVFFMAISVISMAMASSIDLYFNIASIIIVLPTAVVLGIAATSTDAFKLATRLTFFEATVVSEKAIKSARRFISVTGNQCLWMGLIGFIIGSISMADSADSDNLIAFIGPALGVNFLTLLYGVMLKSLCYSAEQKLLDRYLLD